MVCWEILLSKGQEWDWLGDPFFPGSGARGGVPRGIRWADRPRAAISQRRSSISACFWIGTSAPACIIIFCAFAVLYANTTLLPAMLQSLFGYDATTSGLVLSPAGIFAVMMLVVVGFCWRGGPTPAGSSWVGFSFWASGVFWLSRMNLSITPWQVRVARVVIIAGLSMIFAPLKRRSIPKHPASNARRRGRLLALLRNEGGSVGTSLAQTILERRLQFHGLRLNEQLDPFNPTANEFLSQGRAFLLQQQTGDPVLSGQMGSSFWPICVTSQALLLSYFDVFWLCAVVAVVLAFLVLLDEAVGLRKKARTSPPNEPVHSISTPAREGWEFINSSNCEFNFRTPGTGFR